MKTICEEERKRIQEEMRGENVEWQSILQMCINYGFLSEAERILDEKLGENWTQLKFDVLEYKILLSFKAFMHSLIAKDEFTDRWLKRLNDAITVFNKENLYIHPAKDNFYLFFAYEGTENRFERVISFIEPLFNERDEQLRLLTPKFQNSLNSVYKSLKRLEEFKNYLNPLKSRVSWQEYLTLRSEIPEKAEIKELLSKIPSGLAQNFKDIETPEKKLNSLILNAERREIEKIFEGSTFQFKIDTQVEPTKAIL